MTLTPQDIQSKQFHTALRGFNMEEVDDFLEKVAEEMLILTIESKQAKERIEALEKEIEDYKEQEKTFRKAILSAQKISDEIEEKTRQKAEETLGRAKEEAEEMLARAREESEALRKQAREDAERLEAETADRMERLKREIDALSRMREEAVDELRAVLNRYLAAIEGNDFSVPSRPEAAETPPAPEERPEDTTVPDADRQQEPAQAAGPREDAAGAPEDDVQPQAREDAASTPPAAPEEASSPAGGGNDQSVDDDLSDLYRKIDLLDREPDPGEKAAAAPETAVADGDDDLAIPELDDDILFNLDDPLDDLEPSIAINPEKRSE